MTKEALLKKLDNMLGQAEREKTWGQIEIELRDGTVALLRKTSTERFNIERETTHDSFSKNNR
jgi:hypothetical protein